eukprot:10212756-Lingulodinium_polyedra.AAC.1
MVPPFKVRRSWLPLTAHNRPRSSRRRPWSTETGSAGEEDLRGALGAVPHVVARGAGAVGTLPR